MEYDDWIFDSIKNYKNLSIYDMQQCVTAMDWTSSTSLCVGTSAGDKYEILELALPDKMLEEKQGSKLTNDRDFRLQTGGFCKAQVTDIKHIPDTRYCVTAVEGETSINMWKMGDSDTDLMREEKTMCAKTSTSHPTRISVHTEGGSNTSIAFGSSLNNTTVVDTKRFEKVRDFSEMVYTDLISSMFHQTSNIVNCCTTEGDIFVFDLRCEKINAVCCYSVEKGQKGYWTVTKLNNQSNSMFLASTSGDIIAIDGRFLKKCVKRTNARESHGGNTNNFCIQGSPDCRRISLSGLDGMVYIYNSPEETSDDILEPVFVHEGHVRNCESKSESVCVVKHMWYPWQKDLIISAATDSSLHAWQYILT